MNDAAAFHRLFRLLAGQCDGDSWSVVEIPAIDRLRQALIAPPHQVSNTDLAVLLRQALIFESMRRNWAPLAECDVLGDRWVGFQDWSTFGLKAISISGGWRVSPQPWQPDWVEVDGTNSIEARASGETVCRHFESASVPADPFLSKLNRKAYRSTAQRNAVRAALRAPIGSTLVIMLATGEGKSLISHAVAIAGYGSYPGQSSDDGVTLVVVPTVTLALDQEAGALDAGFKRPLAYRSGEQANNQQIIERIEAGSQSLCYASPEAVCGALREPLKAAARAGYLKAIVIDEAHLVDAWGTGFRTEFQLLGGLRRELIQLSPEYRQPRTLLLSATLTEASLTTLRTLFGTPGEFTEIAGASLRPEPEYWSSSATNETERVERVIEALYHAPRPAILYVTRVSDAENWFQRIYGLGFRRISLVTGKTSLLERDATLLKWRAGDIDLVIATSAFGLGIDYPHVRSIIHACIPESLDRFYQEVGRGGRDGRACMSLLIPAHDDWSVAKRISDVTVIGIDRGLQRWLAMFEQAEHIPNSRVFRVRLSTSPGFTDDDIDMVGERSADWNARTLTLMERAGLIRQCGIEHRMGNNEPWQKIEILDHDHLHYEVWQRRVGPLRQAIAEANSSSLYLMRQYILRQECITRLLIQLYGDDRVGAVCTSCSQCRAMPASRISLVGIARTFPWQHPLPPSDLVLALMDGSSRLIVFYDSFRRDSRWFRRLGEVFEVLGQNGVINLTLLANQDEFDKEVTERLSADPWFVAKVDRLLPGRLPPGPEVILSTERPPLTRANLSKRDINKARIFILPLDTESPDRPGIRLSQCFDGRMFFFDEFHQRLMR
jgi:superfamily II DNA or RNA helicase